MIDPALIERIGNSVAINYSIFLAFYFIIFFLVSLLRHSFIGTPQSTECATLTSSRYLELLRRIVHVDSRTFSLNAGLYIFLTDQIWYLTNQSENFGYNINVRFCTIAIVVKMLTKWSNVFSPAYFTRTEQFLQLLRTEQTSIRANAAKFVIIVDWFLITISQLSMLCYIA